MHRIWITGSSGVGKTTLARTLAARLDIPHLELDSLYHGPNWTPADPEDFRAQVQRATEAPGWVIDGNYRSVLGTLVAERADLRIALDLSTWRTMSRVVRRTLRRGITGAELWNGNTESIRNLLRWDDPQQNIILWTWRERAGYHLKAAEAEAAGRAGGLPCARLSSPGQVRRFVRHLCG